MLIRSQKIALNPNNKQSTLLSQHAGYARVAFNFGLSSFKSGLDKDEWRSYIDIKREFNAVKHQDLRKISGKGIFLTQKVVIEAFLTP